jgi:hypothetical protein
MSAYCPPGANSGLVRLQGPITQQLLTDISRIEHPFISSFAPRSTRPTLIKSFIDELSENTCTVKGVKYTLIRVQICSTVHEGYSIKDMPTKPGAELIITYGNPNSPINFPKAILICMPIYEVSSGSLFSAYLDQFVDSTAPIANLQTLFFRKAEDDIQLSLYYTTCYEYVVKNNSKVNNLSVFYFPLGIHMISKNYQLLMSKVGTLLSYQLPPVLRENSPTVLVYTYNDGVKTIKTQSSDGFLYTTNLSVVSNDFKLRYEFYTKPPKLPGKFNENCPYYKVSQYKCVPFDRLKHLQKDYVITDGKTLESILKADSENTGDPVNDKVPITSLAPNAKELTNKDKEIIVASVLGGIASMAVVVFVVHKILKSEPM